MTSTNDEDTQTQLQDMYEYMKNRVKSGYVLPEQFPHLVEEGIEYVEFVGDVHKAQHILDTVVAELITEQTHTQYTQPTNYERLTQAFATLEAQGVLVRENFTCCQTCGNHEIWDEIEEEANLGRDILGYVFFHEQDTERAVDGDGLYLVYNSVDNKKTGEDIGSMIVQAMNTSGLETTWTGSLSQRIFVNMKWDRKLDLIHPTKNTLH